MQSEAVRIAHNMYRESRKARVHVEFRCEAPSATYTLSLIIIAKQIFNPCSRLFRLA